MSGGAAAARGELGRLRAKVGGTEDLAAGLAELGQRLDLAQRMLTHSRERELCAPGR